MNFIDIIAILGALAWLPQIIAWIYNWLKKPKLSIYHDGEAEIGYIKNGNAFNLRFSFLSRDKHALIDDMELVLTDKDGAHHKLKWIWYSETFYELQGPTGNSIMAKQQNAIAINALKDALIEKFIGFQSIAFLEKRKQLAYKQANLSLKEKQLDAKRAAFERSMERKRHSLDRVTNGKALNSYQQELLLEAKRKREERMKLHV